MLYIYINTICIKECKLLLYCRKIFNQKCALCKKSFHWLKYEIKKTNKIDNNEHMYPASQRAGHSDDCISPVEMSRDESESGAKETLVHVDVYKLDPYFNPGRICSPAAAANKSKGNCKRQVNLAWSITGSHFMTQWTSGGASPPGADHVKMHHLHRPPHIKQDNLFCTFGWNCCKLN